MKKLHYIFLAIITLSVACEKPKFEEIKKDLYEKKEIKGIVFLEDTYKEMPTVIAPEATVYLAENRYADPYLIKVKADKDGNFSFTHRSKSTQNFLVGEYTDKNGILYKTDIPLNDFFIERKLRIVPQYPKGKLKVTVKDNNAPINGVKVYIFTNNAFAESIKSTNVSGAIGEKVTNEQGVAFFYDLEKGNMAPRKYWVAGKLDNQIFGPSEVEINDYNNVVPLNPTLSTYPPIQISLKVLEAGSMQPLFGLEVHLFTSFIQAQSIQTTPLTAIPSSVLHKVTDSRGIVSFTGPPLNSGQNYYIGVRDLKGVKLPYPHLTPVVAQTPAINPPTNVFVP